MSTASPQASPRSVWACTIIACNYLPAARVLADSFLSHHPDGRFFVLIIDLDEDGSRLLDESFESLTLGDLDEEMSTLHQMAAAYSVLEFATSVKPFLLKCLLARGASSVLYLDPDIQVFHPLHELARAAEKGGIVLTPHATQPMPRDGKETSETSILAAGIYNLGFIGVGTTAGPFLDFWSERLRRECFVDPTAMRFVDQRWVDFVPGMFDCDIIRDPTCNVAYWNLDHRDLRRAGASYKIDEAPLKFFHFSGYSPEAPHLLSKHQGPRHPRILLSERPDVRRICDEYGKALLSHGFSDDPPPYGLSKMANGVTFDHIMRQLYRLWLRESDEGQRSYPPDIFDRSGADEFLEALNRSPGVSHDPGQLSWYQATLYGLRKDELSPIFPDPQGADRNRFSRWLTDEAQAGRIHPLLVRPPRGPNVRSEPAHFSERAWASKEELRAGVNLVGYLRAELGVGQAARLLASTLEVAGIPFSTVVNTDTQSRQEIRFGDDSACIGEFDINVVAVNADQFGQFASDVGPGFFADRYTIGQWAWELEEFPPEFESAFSYVDEVWAISEFVRESIAARTTKPVYSIPPAIPIPNLQTKYDRKALGLPSDRIVFLFCFDLLSVLERKNPIGLIDAFKIAFPAIDEACLVLKVINGDKREFDLERVRYHAADRPDILIIDEYLEPDRLAALMDTADCYVSLHRSEGFGLTMAEAMALGKPVIATAYSGNLDFMDNDTAYLVDYASTEVPEGCAPYRPGAIWADPDVEQAAYLMRRVKERPADAAELGLRARESILEKHGMSARTSFVQQRFAAIESARKGIISSAPSPVAPLTASEPASDISLNQLAASRPPLGVGRSGLHDHLAYYYRRLVLRAQRHHDDHQRRINVALAESVAALHAEQKRLSQEVADSDALSVVLSNAHENTLREQMSQVEATFRQQSSRFKDAEARLDEIRAIPYMSDPSILTTVDKEGRPAIGFGSAGMLGSNGGYADFEDIFRGPEIFIQDRQRVYLPYLVEHVPVLEIGSGRGELLDLLSELGIHATGVDLDASMVDRAKGRGLVVEHADGVDYLSKQADASLGSIFSAQVIEHLSYESLLRLFDEGLRCLRDGGLLIAETVNPHSVSAFKTFWTDLTHRVPIFPEVAVALCRESGFSEAVVTFPNGTGKLEQDRWHEGEYAVIARK